MKTKLLSFLPALLVSAFCYAQTTVVTEQTALKVEARTVGYCRQMVPAGWLATTNKEGSGLDLWDPEHTMYAGWLISAVNSNLAIFYGKELYNKNPERSILKIGSMVVEATFGEKKVAMVFSDETNDQFGDYRLRSVAAGNYKGVILYRVFPGDGFNYTYIEAIRMALTRSDIWEQKGELVTGVAMSIACTTQLRPGEAPSIPTGSRLKSSASKTKKDDYGYNVQLGTEYCHNPRTGENFRVSSGNWSNTGPDGPGYYGMAGNERIKMAPGRSN